MPRHCISVRAIWSVALLSMLAAAPAWGAERVDPAVVRLLQREVEMLRATIDEMHTRVGKLEATPARPATTPDELARERARVTAVEQRLVEIERRLGALEAAPEAPVTAPTAERAPFALDGHVFIRPEYANNLLDFDNQGDDEDFSYRQRIRLGATLRPIDWLTLRVDLQNATTWGTEFADDSDVRNHLGLHQAYLRFDAPFAPGLSLTAGRMELEYGAGRLVGADDFQHVPRFFDGAVLRYEVDRWIRADLFATVLDDSAGADEGDRDFFGLYATSTPLDGYTFDLYALYLTDRGRVTSKDVWTIGARVAAEPVEGLTFDGEVALQVGTVAEGPTEVDHLATAYYAALDYAIPIWGRPTIGAFFSSASGDANGADDRSVDFEPLFPSQHAFWGRLDLIQWTNVIDFGGRVRLFPVEGLDVLAEFHRFQAVDPLGAVPGVWNRRPTIPNVDSALGYELDLVARYRVHPRLVLELGYSFFLPDTGVKQVRGNDDRVDWAYLQVRVDLDPPKAEP